MRGQIPPYVGSHAPKTGRGRAKVAIRVPDVESVECSAGGLHRLTNTRAGKTLCEGCGAAWSLLDEQIRAELGWKAYAA